MFADGQQSEKNFPDYLVFKDAQHLASSLAQFNVDKTPLFAFYYRFWLFRALMQHKANVEPAAKFFKDSKMDTKGDYRYADIKAASQTVIDDPYYFPLRINRLVVNGYQIGLAMSAPKVGVLPNYYQFLLEKRIPAIHILLQEQDFLWENNMPRYFEPVIEQNQSSLLRLTPLNNLKTGERRNTLFLSSSGIEAEKGKIRVSIATGETYHRHKASESKTCYLTLQQGSNKHCVTVLQSLAWEDKKAISIKNLDELLSLRNHVFAYMQRSNIITHCRAGVGRTGTLLTAEVMSKLNTSLVKTVISLRDSRNNAMVQTASQLKILFRWTDKKSYQLY